MAVDDVGQAHCIRNGRHVVDDVLKVRRADDRHAIAPDLCDLGSSLRVLSEERNRLVDVRPAENCREPVLAGGGEDGRERFRSRTDVLPELGVMLAEQDQIARQRVNGRYVVRIL